MQMVWLDMYKVLQRTVPENFMALLHTIIKRRTIDTNRQLQRDRGRLDLTDRPLISTLADPEREFGLSETTELVHNALAALPPHYAAVIRMRCFDELSNREVAERLIASGFPAHGNMEKRVQNYWYLGRAALREQLVAI